MKYLSWCWIFFFKNRIESVESFKYFIITITIIIKSLNGDMFM